MARRAYPPGLMSWRQCFLMSHIAKTQVESKNVESKNVESKSVESEKVQAKNKKWLAGTSRS